MALREIGITDGGGQTVEHLGRSCVVFDERAPTVVPMGALQVLNGTIQLELALSGERAFPGVAWRIGGSAYESFFVRPHQSGNPDSVQYTPVFNNVSAWQLYHGSGFWNAVELPIGRWFKLRVCFAADRGEAYIDDMSSPAIAFARLRAPVVAGGIGILPGSAGGDRVHFSGFAFDSATPKMKVPAPRADELEPGTVRGWYVSNILAEGGSLEAARTWTYLETEATGLANVARIHPLGMTLNTVFCRTTIDAAEAGTRSMELGFSDRAVVYLDGRPVFAGRDDYRSRDYRFLGSIGYWDTLFLPLEKGANELVVAVSETLGGWGLKARFRDPVGISFRR